MTYHPKLKSMDKIIFKYLHLRCMDKGVKSVSVYCYHCMLLSSTLYSCLNVKELLPRNRRNI